MLNKHCVALTVLLILCLSITLLGNESVNIYFPGTIDSFWVYVDQNGNEITRTAVEGEEIAGQIFPAFSYDPELEDWTNYNWFTHPYLYNVSDEGITIVAGEGVEEEIKLRLKNEMDTFIELLMEQMLGEIPPGVEIPNFTMDIDSEAKGQEQLLLLPENVVINEEWDVNQIEVNATLDMRGDDVPAGQQLMVDYTIIETGIVLGTETVETDAGIFEDCLKVEYRTETTATLTPEPPPDEVDPPGETVTTVWFAPNVGIVKLHQKSGHLFLDLIPKTQLPIVVPENEEKTFELINYEIKTADTEDDTEN